MKVISVFDTSVSDYNLGNEIIMEGVYEHLRGMFPDDFFYKLPYMEITRHTLGCISNSDLLFFGGTNSLSSQMEKYKQWGVTLFNSIVVHGVVLMGLGWWQYQKHESLYTKLLLRRVLSHAHFHSVRDSYTETKLCNLGFSNVINTGCPTTWNLTPSHCAGIRKEKGVDVVFTVTDYRQDWENDRRWVELLLESYRQIFVWVQGVGDSAYLDRLVGGKVRRIPPSLSAFDQILADPNIDYVGTRLHGGIRALQRKRRTIIIAVDNRAIEIQKNINIPVVSRNDIEALRTMIHDDFIADIRIPVEAISLWKRQFITGPKDFSP